ncbi:MAG TPA: response regulator, partial [Chloroflexota bacterium]|nr:response regulator [Chloroflexota bacterium]
MPVATRRVALVIEDEHDLRETVAGLLEEEGYTLLTAPNGAEALRLTQQRQPDVILLDMRLPVMDGWEFARRYRSGPPPHAPIVVMTAAVDAQQRAREIGATAALPKPFLVDDLLACLATLPTLPQA